MKRRAFIATLGGAAVWPLAARAQRKSVVGSLFSGSTTAASLVVRAGFTEGLREGGYRIDDNLTLEYRSTNFQNDLLPTLAAELVHRQVDVILASGSLEAALAAKAATTTIPIVFVNGADPVASGLVTSLNKPGGNVTGVSTVIYELAPKRLELLKELFPGVRIFALLVNTASALADTETRELHAAARALDITLDVVAVERKEDFTQVALVLTRTKPRALIVSSDPFFATLAGEVVELMAGCGVPAMFTQRIFPNAGGLRISPISTGRLDSMSPRY